MSSSAVLLRILFGATVLVVISEAAVAESSPRRHDVLSRTRRAVECPPLKVDRLLIQPELTDLLLSWEVLDDSCRKNTSRIIVHWKAEGGKDGTESLESHAESLLITGLRPWEKVDVEAYVLYNSENGNTERQGPTTKETVSTLKGKPSAPRNFTVTKLRPSDVTAEWEVPETRNGPIDSYEWNACDVPTCNEDFSTGCKTPKDVGNVTSYTVTNLKPLNSYLFFLYAYNKNEGARKNTSDPVKLCVTAPPPPVPPLSGVRAECSSNPNKVSVSWNPAPKPHIYRVYHVSLVGGRGDGKDSIRAENVAHDSACKGESCSFTFENLKGGVEYWTSVRPYHESVGPFGETFVEKSCRIAASGQDGTRTALNIILTLGLPLLLSVVLVH